jgi:hypothetical protein
MRDPSHHEYQVEGPLAEDLIRNVDVSAARIVRFRRLERIDGRRGVDGRLRRLNPGGCRLVRFRHRSDEAIAAAMDRLDELRRLRIVGQHPADLADADLQGSVADEDPRPDPVEELVFRHEPARPLRQTLQDRKSFRGQREGLRPEPQGRIRDFEAEGTELDGGLV